MTATADLGYVYFCSVRTLVFAYSVEDFWSWCLLRRGWAPHDCSVTKKNWRNIAKPPVKVESL